MLSLAPKGPFDPDYDLWADPPRRRTDPPGRRFTYRPKMAPVCRWCNEQYINPIFFDPAQNHPDMRFLCDKCRGETYMFIGRYAMHTAKTFMQATDDVLHLMDLEGKQLPE